MTGTMNPIESKVHQKRDKEPGPSRIGRQVNEPEAAVHPNVEEHLEATHKNSKKHNLRRF